MVKQLVIIPVSGLKDWDTSQVIDMTMFALAESFNEPIRHWKTGKVTDMSSMFQQSYVFDQDISDWDTSQVTDMSYMFQEATAFDKVFLVGKQVSY